MSSIAVRRPAPPVQPDRARVVDDPEAVKEIRRRAAELASQGLRGAEMLRALGIKDDDSGDTILRTPEELDAFLDGSNACAPSS